MNTHDLSLNKANQIVFFNNYENENKEYIQEDPSPYHIETIWDHIQYYIKNTTQKEIFFGICIFCIFFLITKKSYILSFILLSICIFIYFFYKNKQNTLLELKKSVLYPKSKWIMKEPKIYDFIFTIQEFYEYNPQVYIDIIVTIDKLLSLYNEIKINNYYAGQYYDKVKDLKLSALNSFQSFIYRLPDNNKIIDKYNNAKYKLEELLDYYTDDIIKLNKNYMHKNGIDYQTKLINDKRLKFSYNDPLGQEEQIISSINKII